MFGHRFHRLVFVGARSDALPICKHEPLMGSNLLNYVLGHFDAPGSRWTRQRLSLIADSVRGMGTGTIRLVRGLGEDGAC
jgi:hypothetical protein